MWRAEVSSHPSWCRRMRTAPTFLGQLASSTGRRPPKSLETATKSSNDGHSCTIWLWDEIAAPVSPAQPLVGCALSAKVQLNYSAVHACMHAMMPACSASSRARYCGHTALVCFPKEHVWPWLLDIQAMQSQKRQEQEQLSFQVTELQVCFIHQVQIWEVHLSPGTGILDEQKYFAPPVVISGHFLLMDTCLYDTESRHRSFAYASCSHKPFSDIHRAEHHCALLLAALEATWSVRPQIHAQACVRSIFELSQSYLDSHRSTLTVVIAIMRYCILAGHTPHSLLSCIPG